MSVRVTTVDAAIHVPTHLVDFLVNVLQDSTSVQIKDRVWVSFIFPAGKVKPRKDIGLFLLIQ